MLEDASRFVELLTGDPETRLHWRAIVDEKPRKLQLGAAGAHNFRGRLQSALPKFNELQDDGHGVFAVINGGGQDDASIDEYRALFVDADGIPLPEDWHAEPDFLVLRDETHWHAYWLLMAGAERTAWIAGMRRLALHYGTDIAICNSSRVMRTPGFLHLKDPDNPIMVTLKEMRSAQADACPRAITELTHRLPALPAPTKSHGTGEPVTRTMVEGMLAHIDPECARNTWLAVAGALMNANVVGDDGSPDESFDGQEMFTRWSAGEFQPNA